MRTANYTDLRKNLKNYFDCVVNNCEPLVIHRPANTSVVVMSLNEYNSLKEMEYLMASPAMIQRIKDSEREIHEGKGKAIPIEDLWK
ncbi:MAG: type II toxin-antitoxin system Phd/YefM family antitoxin [Bacteroidales bacterium]|nr:type II toxin-antitoxin system Phd/YefM family antitoxin [Bacteroidales bacterium]